MRKLTNQHGDVLIFSIDTIPEKVIELKAKNGRNILAEGESTGHAHAILENPHVTIFEDKESNKLYMEITGDDPVDIVHEEHKTQQIKPGKYEIGRVVEIDPFEEEIRNVQD